MNIPSRTAQSGFTLVEIAIVLVIIGLLLGGVLKGTELIDNAKVKKAANELNGMNAAYYAYLDRYNRVPGGDNPLATLQGRGGSWASITAAGDADGILEVTAAQTFTGAGENAAFWQHLKAAGFISGDPSLGGLSALPRNAFGGLLGVTNAAVGSPALNGVKLCTSQVPGKAAVALESQLDDGLGNTGRIRATRNTGTTHQAPTAAAFVDPFDETAVYTLCMQL